MNSPSGPVDNAPVPHDATPRRGGRWVILFMVVAIGILVAVGFALRPTIERYYHLAKLRETPSRVEGFLLAEDLGAPQREALTRFLDEPAGKQALFELYLIEYDRRLYDDMTIVRLLGQLTRQDCDGGLMTLHGKRYSFGATRGRRAVRSHMTLNAPEDARRRGVILERLEICLGTRFRAPTFPRFEFELVKAKDGYARLPSWDTDPAARPTRLLDLKAEYVCYFRFARP